MGHTQMPLFGFHCKKCDKEMELLIDTDAVAACRYCGSRRLQRLMSRVAPPGRSRGFAKAMRAQAGREGHLSNFSKSERLR
jgi:putative FmdB family regulatory protein